jgi:hypothetical protein
MEPDRRRELVEQYRAGYDAIAAALAGLDDAALDRRPADGGWTAREVVHHTADSEMTSAIRLRRLIAEDDPSIVGYDGDEFARRLRYGERAIEPALAAIAAARATTAQILDGLSDADWQRTGTHSESGKYSVEHWLEIYAVHCDDHADQIRRAAAGT